MGETNGDSYVRMSYTTLFALLGMLVAGVLSYGAMQSDVTTLRKDVATQSIQIDKLNAKVDNLLELIYNERSERRNDKRESGRK